MTGASGARRSLGGIRRPAEVAPVLPRSPLGDRLEALDQLDTLIFNDVRATFDEMVANGWTPQAALESIAVDYRAWLLGRFADAIELSCDVLTAAS